MLREIWVAAHLYFFIKLGPDDVGRIQDNLCPAKIKSKYILDPVQPIIQD